MRRTVILVLISALLTSGCVENRAYNHGLNLMSQGRIEEGLADLERVSREKPDNAEYRSIYFRQREMAANRLVAQADASRLGEQHELAETVYRRVLGIEPENARAKAGLEAIATARRHGQLLGEASEALKENKLEEADAKVRRILLENPGHGGAKQLQRTLAERGVSNRLAPSGLGPAFKRKVSLDFHNANLQAVFDVLSQASGINFVFDREVRIDLATTIRVRQAPIEEAFRLLLSTSQLSYKVLSENAILVYPNQPAKSREYQDTVVRSFYLANGDVKQAFNLIKTVVKTRDVFIDEKLNLLVMRDTPEAVRLAEKLIAMQDLAESEVVLEVEVLEMSHKKLTDLGVTPPTQIGLSIRGPLETPTSTTLVNGSVVSLTGEEAQRPLSLESLKHLNAARIQVSPISATIKFGMEKGDTNILANPRIRVKNREKAKVHIGERVPVITTTVTSAGNTSFLPETVNYLDVGIKLEVEPNVHLSDEVEIKVGLEVSSLGQKTVTKNGSEVYRVGTRNVSTMLRLKDGETQALAGLISNEELKSVVGIPGLGDIPVLGRLFSSHSNSNDKTEIVLLITPRIIHGLARPEAGQVEFFSGTQDSFGDAPLALGGGEDYSGIRKASKAARKESPESTQESVKEQ